jgi:hypothetical protein
MNDLDRMADEAVDIASELDKPNVIAAILTDVVAVAVSIIAIKHPGFHDPAWVKEAIPPISVAIAGWVHSILLRRAQQVGALRMRIVLASPGFTRSDAGPATVPQAAGRKRFTP